MERKTTIPMIGAVNTVERETPVSEYYENEWDLPETGQKEHKPAIPKRDPVVGETEGFSAQEILSAKLAAWLSGYLAR